jgi:hypothetical protein
MKKIKVLSLLFLTLSATNFVACGKDEPDFIIAQESDTIDNIINARLITVDDNNQEIDVTTHYIKDKWERALSKEGFKVELGKFQILEGFDKDKGTKLYFLKTISTDGTIQTGAFINKTDKEGVYSLRGKVCTCTGCPTGCNLVISGDKCSCSSCPGPNKSCTKTETGGTGNT